MKVCITARRDVIIRIGGGREESRARERRRRDSRKAKKAEERDLQEIIINKRLLKITEVTNITATEREEKIYINNIYIYIPEEEESKKMLKVSREGEAVERGGGEKTGRYG